MTTLHTEVLKPLPISPERIMQLASEAAGVDAGQLEPYREAHVLFATKLLAELTPQPDAAAIRKAAWEVAADYLCGITDRAGDSASLDNREMHQDEKAVMHALCDAADGIRALSTTLVEPAIPTPQISAFVAPRTMQSWDAIRSETQDAHLAIKGKCRNDDRCQYAIDCGAEQEGHCPEGKCCMPMPERMTYDQLFETYCGQCKLTDELAAKLQAGSDKALLARIAELEADLATMNKRYIDAASPTQSKDA